MRGAMSLGFDPFNQGASPKKLIFSFPTEMRVAAIHRARIFHDHPNLNWGF
jgi:hypothetical protein